MDVGPRLDELRCEPKRFRRRVRVLEASGVGDEGDVERLGDRRRQLDSQLAEDVAQYLSRRRGRGVDEVDVAEARVVVMVVDVECQRHAPEDVRVGDPALVRAVECDKHTLRHVVGPPSA